MTCTLWINFFDGTQPSDLLVRFEDRESANYFTHTLFTNYAKNIKEPTPRELFDTRENADGIVRSDFSVWNAQRIFNPHLPGYDCTSRYTGSGDYTYDYPVDRMRDWTAESGRAGYFWLAVIRGTHFGANVYLAEDGFEPLQKYLADSIQKEITNYNTIKYVEEEDVENILQG